MAHNSDEKRLEKLRARNKELREHSGNYSPMEMISGGMATKYSSKREFWDYVFLFLKIAIVVAVVIVLAAVFFRIDSVTVTNETDFSAEEVISASGVKPGQNLILLDKDKVSQQISKKIPYASNIVISKTYPSKVKISLEKGKGTYYTQIGREYYVMDESCKVIAKTEKIEDIEIMGCVRIQSGKISRCMMGQKLLYRDIDMQDVFDELTMYLTEYGYMGFCGDIILDSKFDIMFTYNDRFTVRLGDLKDLEIKFQFLEKILQDMQPTDSGVINISDTDLHEGIVTLHG